jgi:hypothetical protein
LLVGYRFHVLSTVVIADPIAAHSRLQSSELNEWLDKYPETPGARFVHLLRKHLHYQLGAEDARIKDCHTTRLACFGGAQARDNFQTTLIPTTSWTLHDFLHLNGTDKIPRLGTDPVCLPLVLAGQSVLDAGVVAEFGPFAGMTSRCLGLGLNITGIENVLYAFDTFSNENNWAAIRQQASWVKSDKRYDPKQDFLWVWERVVHSIYPSAQAIKGPISKATANRRVWGNKPVALLSLDSIKDVRHWQDQLEGIHSLQAGSILALQDFILSDQPTMLYACLRDYLIPVFTCWDFWEPWIFIVKKKVLLRLPCECMKKLQDNDADKMEKQALQDLELMGDSTMSETKNKTMSKLINLFRYDGLCNTRAIRKRAAAGRIICAKMKSEME